MKRIRIGDRSVGEGAPCFVAAEIGINHNGDLDLAREMISAAARAGADGVKFQNYRTEDFISDRSLTYTYTSSDGEISESQYDLFKRCELSADDLRALKQHSDQEGVVFHSTPTGESGLQALVDLGVPVLKNGSDFLTHTPFIERMARTNLPLVLATGMATEGEIAEAVDAARRAGDGGVLLLHCTSAYPTPPEAVNLRRIPAMASRFECLVGLSDHSQGVVAAAGAVALGACWIEKHFTTDRTLPGPDHRFSSDPEELRQLVRAVRTLEAALGSPEIAPAEIEADPRRSFRLSCIAARALPAGHVLSAGDIGFARPATGLAPGEARRLVGRTLRRGLREGEQIQMEDVS